MPMHRMPWYLGILTVTLLLTTLAFTTGAVQESRSYVVNLRTPHPIEGEVGIVGPITHSKVVRMNSVVVAPVGRQATSLWAAAGRLETDGFTSVTLSMHGLSGGTDRRAGTVGVVLVPDEARILRSFQENELHLALEATADVMAGDLSYFSGTGASLPLGFPRYRVFVYNTTAQSVTVDIFAYLTN
jgi:hypothetical protein